MAQPSFATPAETSSPVWMRELETAHDLLADAARTLTAPSELDVDVTAVAPTLEALHRELYFAYTGDRDPLDCLRNAQTHAGDAASLLRGLPTQSPHVGFCAEQLDECRKHLGVAESHLAHARWQPPPPAPDLIASIDAPRLHRVPRAPAVPRLNPAGPPAVDVLEATPAINPPASFEELSSAVESLGARARERAPNEEDAASAAEALAAEAPVAGFVSEPIPALSPAQMARERARECFEDIVMLCSQRAPQLGESWRAAQSLERRLLANVDALAALGEPALDCLETLVRTSPAPDPWQLHGLAFVGGCIDGRDLLAAAERILADNEHTPEFADALAGALKVTENPLVCGVLQRWLEHPSPTRRAIAVEVLGYRGWASFDQLDRACLDEPVVAVRALPRFALGNQQRVREVLDDLSHRNDPALEPALWHAMVLAGHPAAPSLLGARLAGERALDAAVLLAISGERRDAELLAEQCRAVPSAALATALGWAGSVESIPLLIAVLGNDDEETVTAAADALERITGPGLYEAFEVPPELVMESDVAEPKVDDETSEPAGLDTGRDSPSEGSADTIDLPARTQETWKQFWLQNQQRFAPGQRYRRGHPYSPLVSLWELDTGPCTPRDRRLLQTELVLCTGEYSRFDPHDFVAVQETALEAWRPAAERGSTRPGMWNRPARRFGTGASSVKL